MPKFLVKTPIQMNGKPYEPGSTIELTDEQAAAMPWAVEALPEPAAAPASEITLRGAASLPIPGGDSRAGEILELTAKEAQELGPKRVGPLTKE